MSCVPKRPQCHRGMLSGGRSRMSATLDRGGEGMLSDFKKFILRGNVVDLAVGVVMGVAFGAVITALVTGLLTPLIGAIVGQHDFSKLHFTVNKSVFLYGS